MSASILLVFFSGCQRKRQPAQRSAISNLEQPGIRVLLEDDVTTCLFSCDVGVTVTVADSVLPEARFKGVGKPAMVKIAGGKVFFAGWSCPAGKLEIKPDANAIFSINNHRYRGTVQIVVGQDGNSFDVINVVGSEAYLAGVIGAEMPSYWEPQALEAQVIAGRTYCLYIKEQFGANRHWDVRKTAANQMYKGVDVESRTVWQAIENTAGEVLICRQPDGTEDIFGAYYSSACAGHTENSKNVFGDEFEPLAGVPCKYCIGIAKKEFLNWPTVYVTKTQLNEKLFARYPQLKKLGEIEQISALSPSRYDDLTRLTWIELEGTGGNRDILRAEDFRLAIDPTGFKIKSAAFEIQKTGNGWAFALGRGYGHGVGMCQCGAQGMARKGKSAEEILSYYYPGSKIKKIY